eukprot:CAMPEP_0198318414 /NCGR_PEP_ID=MMETSP1450-20131203/7738_1 /TAXON_ID=753684 ORGANISM="Madagascaria erythrocladiodes, Strain CCMP3234" /NCGR_SAMPLE_ID=MMETSP1450 /ASSEMBLY_ACC=CAM_ASM_001115 /LENGTH=64 /DNA_ID=CAMNT_0044021711 /DNA_START=20 /DNA_END=214 /DNA_ORIENTATION=+
MEREATDAFYEAHEHGLKTASSSPGLRLFIGVIVAVHVVALVAWIYFVLNESGRLGKEKQEKQD